MPQLISSLGRVCLEATSLQVVWINGLSNDESQQWVFEPQQGDNNVFRIRSVSTNLLLTYSGQESGPVFLRSALPQGQSVYQNWCRSHGNTFHIITALNLDHCLDVCNAFSNAHRHVIEWHIKTRGNIDNQLWSIG